MIPCEMGVAHLLQEKPDEAVSQFEVALKLLQGERPKALSALLGLAYG